MSRRCILGKYSLDPGIWCKFLWFWCFSNSTHLLAHSSIDQKVRWVPLRSMLRVSPGWNPDVLSGRFLLSLMERIASGLIQLLVVVRLTFPFSCSAPALSSDRPLTFLLRWLPPSSHQQHLESFSHLESHCLPVLPPAREHSLSSSTGLHSLYWGESTDHECECQDNARCYKILQWEWEPVYFPKLQNNFLII